MPFGRSSHRDFLFWIRPQSAAFGVTNAFRQIVSSGPPACAWNTPLILRHQCLSADRLIGTATRAPWSPALGELSPMPFGRSSHRDLKQDAAGYTTITASPMPFGRSSHRDFLVQQNNANEQHCHQCLSADRLIGTTARSGIPMPTSPSHQCLSADRLIGTRGHASLELGQAGGHQCLSADRLIGT